MRIVELNREARENILSGLLKRDPNNYQEYEATVRQIVDDVRERGDEAVSAYTEKFDGVRITPETIRVTEAEIEDAYGLVDKELVGVMERSAKNIREYHEKQRQYSWFDSRPDGTLLGQKVTPLESAGVYVPGGKAAYPSSVLMNILPAKVAGVPRIVMVTPPEKNGKVHPVTLVAAHLAGATEVYKVGGAQAIAALAFGTGSIPRVHKITGPGNIFVALAKKAVYGHVSIDSIAGPSEIMVIADETANPRFVAADLLSQAEHDKMASAVLITTSEELAKKVQTQIETQLPQLLRQEIARASIDNKGKIIVTDSIEQAIEIANDIAPEHLELCVDNPFDYLNEIKHAGSIFLGKNCPEALGDYFAGPNHTLPTSGTARFSSPLSVDDFVKKSQFIYYAKGALQNVYKDVACFAEHEGLTAHAKSATVRFEDVEQ